jgi:hypothetical protein
MICNKNESNFRITYEYCDPIPRDPNVPVPPIASLGTTRDKMTWPEYIKGFDEGTFVLFDVCAKCVSERGSEIAHRGLKSIEELRFPAGRYKGRPIHQMNRIELIQTIHEIAQYKYHAETFQMVDGPTAMRRIMDGKKMTGEDDDEHR